ncbi:hypothetical protein BDN72DRAFT_743923, partial [Pluteus cervinus]
KMKDKWTAPAYAFFHADPIVGTNEEGKRYLGFRCSGRGCKYILRRTEVDRGSTGNFWRHIRVCWGEDVEALAKKYKTAADAKDKVATPYRENGSITAAFAFQGEGKPTYSTRPLTKTQTKTYFARWVCENLRPFRIVKDRCLKVLL